MRGVICVVILVGCDLLAACSSSPSSSTTPTPAARPDAAIANVLDAAPPIDAAPAVDAELAATPASVFRFHSTGSVPMPTGPRLETWTLRHTGGRGMVTIELMAPDGENWKPASTTVFHGTAAVDGKRVTLALTAGTYKLALDCTRDKLAVAAPTAVRKPHPRKGKYAGECSGDPGRWVPDKTKSVEVLSCKHPDYEVPMPFAAAPGVEYLYVNDDCAMQGGGYRLIAADGAITPVR